MPFRRNRSPLQGTRSSWVLLLLGVGAITACSNLVAKQDEPEYPVEISVESDPKRPLANVEIQKVGGGKALGTTNIDGKAKFILHGTAGEVVSLDVKCPADFLPAKAINVKLQRFASGKPVEHKVACVPTRRKAVFSVVADAAAAGGAFHKDKAQPLAGLKVKIFGVEHATTDESGAAHVLLDVNPNETVKVSVEAPPNYSTKLTPNEIPFEVRIEARDEIYPIPATFRAAKEPPKPQAPRPTGPKPIRGPQRI